MSRFVLLSPNGDFDLKLRSAVANGLRGSVQTIASDILPAGPAELFALLNQEQPEVLIIGPDVLRCVPGRSRQGPVPHLMAHLVTPGWSIGQSRRTRASASAGAYHGRPPPRATRTRRRPLLPVCPRTRPAAARHPPATSGSRAP